MGNDIASQEIVAMHTVRGLQFEVERTRWRSSSGESYDVRQVETGFALHNESLDDPPTVSDIENLIEQLREDLFSDRLDTFHDERETLEFLIGLQPKIQLLHGRDPDSACDIQVYVEGKLVTSVEVEDVDPGRGYRRADWDARVKEAVAEAEAAPDNEFLQHRAGWLQEASDSQFITGEE